MPNDKEQVDLDLLQQRLGALGINTELPHVRTMLESHQKGFAQKITACLDHGGEESNLFSIKCRFVAAYLSTGNDEAVMQRLRTTPPELVEAFYNLVTAGNFIIVDFLFKTYTLGTWSVPMVLFMTARIQRMAGSSSQTLRTIRSLQAIYGKDEVAFARTVDALDALRDKMDMFHIERNANFFRTQKRLEKMVEVLNKNGSEAFNSILAASELFKDDETAFDLFLDILDGVEKHLFAKVLRFMRNQKPFAITNPCVAAVKELVQAKKIKKLNVLMDAEALYAKDAKRFEAFYQVLQDLDDTQFTSHHVKSMEAILRGYTDDEIFHLLLQSIRKGCFYKFQPDIEGRGDQDKSPFVFYKSRPAWFKWLLRMSLKYSTFHPSSWIAVHELYAGQPAKVKTLAELVTECGGEALELFTKLDKSLYDQDQTTFDKTVAIIGNCSRNGEGALSSLGRVNEFVGTDIERLRFLASCAASPEAASLASLNELVPKDKKTTVNLGGALTYMKRFDPRFRERDLLMHALQLEEGQVGAGFDYVEALKEHWDEWKKGLIGEGPASQHRDQPYYRALMIAVFGKGSSYSDVDDAIETPDVPQDVESFQFPEGKRSFEKSLPIQHGYRLIEGRSERLEALAAYKARVRDSIGILAVLKEGDPQVEFRRLLERSYSGTEMARHWQVPRILDT